MKIVVAVQRTRILKSRERKQTRLRIKSLQIVFQDD